MDDVGMNIRDFVGQRTEEQIVQYIIKREGEYKKLLQQNENKQTKLDESIQLNEELIDEYKKCDKALISPTSEHAKEIHRIEFEQYEDRINKIKL